MNTQSLLINRTLQILYTINSKNVPNYHKPETQTLKSNY